MKGELDPVKDLRTACEADLHMDGSIEFMYLFLVWPLPERVNSIGEMYSISCLAVVV